MAKATITIKQSLQYQPQHGAWFAATQHLFNQVAAFYAHLKKWRARKEQALAKGKQFTERPPVPPRTWNTSATLYAGMWKDRTQRSMLIKVWTGTCWSWLKVRLTGRELPGGTQANSPSLVRHAGRWWLHTPVEQRFRAPLKIAQQLSHPETKLCAVDLNLDGSIAVCTVQTAEGTILATRFIGGGRAIAGFRKKQLGRITRNRKRTGLMAEGEQDNAALWQKIRNRDESFAHLVSRRIVQFAQEQGASILVFEHLGNLHPEQGKYSRRGNRKRAFWMKGRIFCHAKYKAWQEGMITSRINPRNTSRECARCHAPIIRYAWGQPQEGYTPGAPLMLCPTCGLRGHADRNASGCIGQRLISRSQQDISQEKPHTPRPQVERGSKDSGVASSQDAEGEAGPSLLPAGHGASNGHGTAHEMGAGWSLPTSPIPHPLRRGAE
jgi:putative transposase